MYENKKIIHEKKLRLEKRNLSAFLSEILDEDDIILD